MKVSTFYEKLNKVDGNIYVVEEEIHLTDGAYEAELQHDNINETTFAVFTGPKLTGTRLETYTLSTPSLAPWKRIVRVYADVPVVYLSYETDGDTVEGDDINRGQDAIVETQEALNAEEDRALKAEKSLADDLQAESSRARTEESRLDSQIDSETGRAQDAEKVLRDDLAGEVTRAKGAEKTLTDNLTAEVTRAKAAEKTLTDNLAAETTRAKAAEKSNSDAVNTEKSRATAAEDVIRSTISTNKPVWDDKYTRDEVDNKFSTLETAIDWKEAVNTYADLAATYPKPDDGWTVNVKDTDYTYRWSGTAWIAISANAIPKATQSVDGLLTKEDKKSYDDAYSKRHTHSNKSTLDKLTETLLVNWSAAYTHISDAVKHITGAERTNWNDANSKKHDHTNKSVIDKLTQAMLDKLAGIATGADVNVRSDWSATDTGSDAYIKNKPATMPANGGTAYKLGGAILIPDYDAFVPSKIAAGSVTPIRANPDAKSPWSNTTAGLLIQSSEEECWHIIIFRSGEGGWAYRNCYRDSWSDWQIWSTFDGAYSSLTGRPSMFPPSSHTHTKSQISDMPTKISQFTNDQGYLTAADVDTSQNHTHANKTVLDKITQALLDTWNGKAGTAVATQSANGLMAAADKKKLDGVATGANNYAHPTTAGNKHVPTGGASGQILGWSADGTAVWTANNTGTAAKWTTARNINGLSVQGDANRVNYGTCSTAAATAAKTVACAGFVLITGAKIDVKFTVTNTAASPTLDVNGTGEKVIYYRGAAISAGQLGTGRTYAFRYNGTQYDLVGDLNTNSTNTAGAANSSSKLFLVGATSQAASPQTYSHDTAYVGTDGCLYSDSKKVSTTDHNHDSVYMKKGAVTWGDLKGV